MASEGANQATFSINLEDHVSESAESMADSVEALRDRIAGSEDAIKEMGGALRRLRGTSDEVKTAKGELVAKLQAEKDKISAANLALLKQGTTYDKLSAQTRKLTKDREDLKKKTDKDAESKAKDRADAMSAAIRTAGGPVASLKEKLETLRAVTGDSSGAMGLATLAAAGLAAAVIAVAAAAAAGVLALGKLIIAGANAARTANLMREAAAGSASNATALGTQVDALADKIPTARGALNDLAISLAKSGVQGQTLVDTFNAVGQASAALGEDAGAKLRELVERGRLTQRLQVNPLELQGTGVQFEDIAKALAKNLKVGVNDARAALFEGRVKLADGAKALRDAVEQKFAGINLRRMLDLNVIAEKFQEKLSKLTSGVDIEPLLRGVSKLAMLFDESTVAGSTLKTLVTLIGNAIGPAFEAVVPISAQFIKGLIIGALDVAIAFFTLKNSLQKAIGGTDLLKNVDLLTFALNVGKAAVYAIATVLAIGAAVVITQMALVGAVIYGAVKAFGELYDAVKWAWDKIATTDWGALGRSIIDGFVNGLKAGVSLVQSTVGGLADTVKAGFKKALGIASPSKVFAQYGEHSAEGYAKGVDSGAPDAAKALDTLAAPRGAALGARGGGATVSINIPITIAAEGGTGKDIAKALEEGVLAKLTKTIEDALVGAGIPASV